MDKGLQKEYTQKAVLTAEALLQRRGIIEKRLDAKVELETGLGVFRFRVPTINDIRDASGYQVGGVDRENEMMIYICSDEPNLREKEIQESFVGENGHFLDVVEKIFLPGEIQQLAENLMIKAGYERKAVKVMEEVKN